jgi:hypothetical protein
MGTTTNNGWTYPESTDLVKDGATAIETLADDIDTTLGVYATPGLVKLQTVTFSGVASVSLPADTFSATYDSYKIIFDLDSVSGVNPQLTMRFRTSGTDNSNANYKAGGLYAYITGGTGTFNDNGTTSINLGQTTTGSYQSAVIDLVNPFATKLTHYFISATNVDTTTVIGIFKSGSFDVTTSFDSASWIVSTGNFAGTVSAYGYNK